MKQLPVVLALMIVAAIAAITPANQAQADSRVIVGVDLGGVVAAFESRPRYIYSRPVVYERRHTWRSLPPPPRAYPPPRWHRQPPPPPRHHVHHGRWHHSEEYRRYDHRR
nr:hypothetical protein [uncultured Desulfobulbus sp.]